MDNGKKYVIKRNQDVNNKIVDDYALTSRACPPFCVQPMQLLPGVHTIGEIEMLKFLKARSDGDKNILIIDSRTPDWVRKGSIPSAINIPWTQLYPESSSYQPFVVEDLLTSRFGAKVDDGIWDFSNAKTLVMFCNGPWCGQSPTNIKALVNMAIRPIKSTGIGVVCSLECVGPHHDDLALIFESFTRDGFTAKNG